MASTFDTTRFFSDNRIMDAGQALRAPYNSTIRANSTDLEPDRASNTYERIHTQMGFSTPSVLDDPVKGSIFEAALAVTAHEVDRTADPLNGDISRPFETLLNASSYETTISKDFFNAQIDAFSIYLALDAAITYHGAADIAAKRLQDVIDTTDRPTLIEVGDALYEITGVDGYALTDIAARQGAAGIMQALNIEQGFAQELSELSAAIAIKDFPLNDLVNWSFGRNQPGMINESAENKIIIGRDVAAASAMEEWAAQAPQHQACEDTYPQHSAIQSALDAVPPALSELFFEMNGTVIFDAQCHHDNADTTLSGNSVYHYDAGQEHNAVNIKYLSDKMNEHDMFITLIHELHHNFFPELIDPNVAMQADDMVAADHQRIEELYAKSWEFSNALAQGTAEDRAAILDDINSYSIDEHPTFAEIATSVPIKDIIHLIDDAYTHVRLDSDYFDKTSHYDTPEQLSRELIPRYAEIRYGNAEIGETLAKFIMPNMSKIYDELYMPHIEEKLAEVKAQHQDIQTQPDTYASNINYDFPIAYKETLAQAL